MNKIKVAYLFSLILLVVSMWFAISIGSVKIPFSTLWDSVTNPTAHHILWNIRMPRVVLAGLVGASLALAGAALQGLLKNPLADPYTLGCICWSGGNDFLRNFVAFFRTVYATNFQHGRCYDNNGYCY